MSREILINGLDLLIVALSGKGKLVENAFEAYEVPVTVKSKAILEQEDD